MSSTPSATPTTEAAEPTDQPENRTKLNLALAVVTVVALLLAIAAAIFYFTQAPRAGEARTERALELEEREKYVETASDVLSRLMTIRQDTLEDDVQAISDRIEGEFAEQFTPRTESYTQVIELTKVVAEGTIVASAVEQLYDDRADVIMAVDQNITNPVDDEAQERFYRMRITVNQHDDGSMKVSAVNFIP